MESGISLLGAEAKALREGHGDLSQAHARIMDGEAFLINANIPAKGITGYNPTRMRKLLLHKNETLSLVTKMKQQKLNLVPLILYTKGRLVKLSLALGKPKRKFEKREAIKEKDIKRELEKELKGK